jgi:hypothetical protein
MEVYSWEDSLFLWAMASMAMLVISRGYFLGNLQGKHPEVFLMLNWKNRFKDDEPIGLRGIPSFETYRSNS